MAPALLVATAGTAFGDTIHNDLDGTIDAAAETMDLTVGGGTDSTTLTIVPANGDGKNGCNLNQNNNQTLTVAVQTSNPAVATVSPTSLVLTSCGNAPVITVTPVGAGTAQVTLSETSNTTGATFDLAPAAFDAVVAGAPNTAPVVTVTGVSDGGSYDKGSVPAAGCDVVDAEDGNSSFSASLSSITGPDAADGIGSQTATCSYTDGGGLNDTETATYDIVDPSAPDIQYALTPAVADGENGWWTSGVDVDWTVTETDSPGSLSTTDCADFSLTADQTATTYTCQASSAGGNDSETTVAIGIDGTDPTIGLADGPADGATYYFGLETVPAAPTCNVSDATSGVNGDGCVLAGWSDQLGSHTITADVEDNAGNTSSAPSISYDVVECNLDTSVIGSAVCAPKCAGVDVTIKGGASPIVGTAGDDVILGTVGADEIDGLGGNDLICAIDGADTVNGGDGGDTIYGGTGADSVNGDAGTDLLRGGGDDDTVNGGDDNDNIGGEAGVDTLNGDSGNDTINGGGGNDTLNGGDGEDALRGGLDDDTISGGAANDFLNGDSHNDTLNGGDGDDTLRGSSGGDTLNGDAGADAINGGTGDDEGNGGAGNDDLVGAGGADDLSGGADDDTINGGVGNDILDGGDGVDSVMGQEGLDTMTGGAGNDTMFGGNHADTMNGNDGDDTLNGGLGNDDLFGDAGNDLLYGTGGADALSGGDDDDKLVGGPDTDTLDGGAGTNVLIQ